MVRNPGFRFAPPGLPGYPASCALSSQTANAPPPVFFAERRVARLLFPPAFRIKTEGARDARGPRGPADLDASRHRGLSKSVKPQVRQTQGVPRAVFIGLLREVPGSRALTCSTATSTDEDQALGQRTSDKSSAVPAVRALDAPSRAPGLLRLGPPGRLAASPAKRHSPGHRSPFRICRC